VGGVGGAAALPPQDSEHLACASGARSDSRNTSAR
jgi:hypothetical protein